MGRVTSRRMFLIGSITTVVAACSSSDQASQAETAAAPVTTPTTDIAQPTTPPPASPPASTTTSAPEAETTVEPVPQPVYTGTADPFTLGVASGDPDSESVVHWTRLAPADTPLDGPITVTLEVSSDAEFDTIISTQDLATDVTQGYSVHGLTTSLNTDTWYWYRFRTGEFTSPVGRSRTTPAPGTAADQLTFATASCQHFESGFYTAHADIATAGVDLVVWLGDYIYEGDARPVGDGHRPLARRPRADDPRRLPSPLRHLQVRPEPTSRPRRLPVVGHLGRP